MKRAAVKPATKRRAKAGAVALGKKLGAVPAGTATRQRGPSAKPATRDHHPARRLVSPKARTQMSSASPLTIPRDANDAEIAIGDRSVRLTNLRKPFWPALGVMKGDLLQYYAEVSPWLLPHLKDRAMVMKRYPDGAAGDYFFMKRSPSPRPEWIERCKIEHASGSVIDFPMVQDLASLLWVVNLGCIDLNPWYARCDDVDRPDWLHFDLDPTPGATFEHVRETALVVRRRLEELGMRPFAKTTGSRGIHVYVAIRRGPTQKQVWTFAKAFAQAVAADAPKLITAIYKVAARPKRHVLVDYNQNAWGRTLASIYSARPREVPSVSAPVTWEEVEGGVTIDDFRIDNVPARLRKLGDLWAPLLEPRGRFELETLL